MCFIYSLDNSTRSLNFKYSLLFFVVLAVFSSLISGDKCIERYIYGLGFISYVLINWYLSASDLQRETNRIACMQKATTFAALSH